MEIVVILVMSEIVEISEISLAMYSMDCEVWNQWMTSLNVMGSLEWIHDQDGQCWPIWDFPV